MSVGPTRIFLEEISWDVRSRNTDWRYVRYAMPQLSQYEPALSFVKQQSLAAMLRGNARTIGAALGRRLHVPFQEHPNDTCRLSASELRNSGANVIFAHRAFPINAGNVPVVWENAIVDPVMQRSYGVTSAELDLQIRMKRSLFRRSAAIQVCSEAEALRHAKLFPEIAERFRAIPLFTPHVSPCAPELLKKHQAASPVRILFVGNQARRKGLDLLLEAFTALPAKIQSCATLTVMSSFDRSPMKLPNSERITILRGQGHERVLEEMQRAHIFVNVARFESYGVVFHEAMSQGLACLAPDWEVQRELFDDGRAGWNLPCEAGAIGEALERLIVDEDIRYSLGFAGWQRFKEKYAPAVVARRYAEVFERAARVGDSAA